MSAIVDISLDCDGQFDDLGPQSCPLEIACEGHTRAQARAYAAERGWSSSGGRDYCPVCTKQRSAERRAAL